MRIMRFAAVAALVVSPVVASASFHLMHVTEVFTNADGTKQFIELEAESDGQTQLSLSQFASQSADGSAITVVYNITTNLPALNENEKWLVATAAAQSELGFTADYTIPDNSIILANGRIRFQDDGGNIVDALAYGAYTGSNVGFGSPAAALPSDGVSSLTRTADTGGNSADFSAQPNSPTNNAGQTGSIGSAAVSDWTMYQ